VIRRIRKKGAQARKCREANVMERATMSSLACSVAEWTYIDWICLQHMSEQFMLGCRKGRRSHFVSDLWLERRVDSGTTVGFERRRKNVMS